MKLGFLSAILPEYTFEQVIDFASENGFACVELACWPTGKAARRYAGVTHIDMTALDDEKVAYIKDYCAKKNVEISGIGYYPNPLADSEETASVARAHIKSCIVGAAKLGVNQVNTFIGRNQKLNPEENKALFEQVWPELIAFAEAHGVKIGIENCPMYFKDEWPNGQNLACSPAFWRYMFKTIDSENFGLNYDPSHLVWQRMDYIKPIYNFPEKMFHIHLKDAQFYQDKFDEAGIYAAPLEFHTPKLPGLGDINWGKVISALNDIDYKGAVILEIEDRAYEETLEDRLNSILLSRDYMRQFVRT